MDTEFNGETFINIIKQAKSEATIIKKFKNIENNKWYNRSIAKVVEKRDRAYKKFKKQPTNTKNKEKFLELKRAVFKVIRKSKQKYFCKKFMSASSSTKKLWNTIKELINTRNINRNIIQKLKINGREYKEPNEICDRLNKLFIHVESDIKWSPIKSGETELNCVDRSIYLKKCSESELKKILQNLKKNASPGNDQITANELILLYPVMNEHLLYYINNALKSGIIPTQCLESKIIPIYKKGDKTDPNNYRPIALTSVFSKLLETVIKNRICSYFNFSNYQYGFQSNSSTLGATTDLVQRISTGIDARNYVIVVFIDLRKAFDMVDHDLLLGKLKKMGINNKAHTLIETFLRNRRHHTVIETTRSSEERVLKGVPQGSVIGPLLYLLFVEDLETAGLEALYYMFADDTALFYEGRDLDTLQQRVEVDLRKFQKWLTENRLILNVEKTVALLFKQKNKPSKPLNIKINGIKINQKNLHTYLGLNIDTKLEWTEHIEYLSRKLTPLIGALRTVSPYLSKQAKKTLYYSNIHSVLAYLISVWSNTSVSNLQRVQRLQNRALKAIYNLPYDTPTTELYDTLKIPNMKVTKVVEQCKLIYKMEHGLLKFNTELKKRLDVHNYQTRQINNYHLDNIRTNRAKNSPIYQAVMEYNNLPEEVKKKNSLKLFIRSLKCYKMTYS